MEERTPLFVGYGTLEEWLDALIPDRPVLAMPLVEQGPEQSGMRTDTLVVICQQIDQDGHVHYCRLRAASLTRCYGEPFNADWREREAAWRSLWNAVQEILRERNLPYRGATVAPPQRLRFLESRAEGVAFDPTLKRFVRPGAEVTMPRRRQEAMTILMERYNQVCDEFPQAIVLMRVGDFFEAYGETAKSFAETFGLTLTERDGIPMSGIPHHMAEKRVAQMVASGKLVILMDQSEDPRGKTIGDAMRPSVQFKRYPSAS